MSAVRLLLVAALLQGAPALAAELATSESVLAAAFPGAQVERRSAALDDSELARIRESEGEARASRVAAWHEARREGAVVGRAYADSHVVRTLPETILVSVDASGRVLRVDVLSFSEPRDYLPPPRWLGQFEGKPLGDDLAVKRGIAALAGATFSGRAVTKAVRRCLALDAVIRERQPDAQAQAVNPAETPAR